MDHAGGIGLTQLEWAPGAAQAFRSRSVPYIMFVRDDTVFRLEERFRPVMEGAALICAAGEGLLGDIQSRFTVQRAHSVPLPLTLEGASEHGQGACVARRSSIKAWKERPSVIGIMVVTPERAFGCISTCSQAPETLA